MDAQDFMPDAATVERIRRDLAAYEPERARVERDVARRVPLFLGGFAIVAGLVGWLLWPVIFNEDLMVLIVVYLFGVIYGAYRVYGFARRPATDLQQSLRDRVLPIAFSFIEDVRYRKGYVPDSFSRLPDEATGRVDYQHFDDLVSGRYRGARFEVAEMRLDRKRGKSIVTAFKGVMFAFAVEPVFPGKLIATRKIADLSRWKRDLFGSGGLTGIASGDPKLDADYEFRTDNPGAAEALFQANLGKALAWVRQTWPGEPALIALSGRDGFLLLPTGGKNFFELPGIAVPLDYKAHVEPIVAEMASLMATAALVRSAIAPEVQPPRAVSATPSVPDASATG